MRDQDQVLDCFPFAEARREPAIHLHGDDPLHRNRDWAIFSGPDHDAALLGRGRTEAIAWEVAAEQLEPVAS